jgi:pimeloyl-ACP methyl ester carboxylesterase
MVAAGLTINQLSHLSMKAAGWFAFELWRRPMGRSSVRPPDRVIHDASHVSLIRHGRQSVVTYRWGDGSRPILLVHGWQSRASRFAPLISRLLSEGFSPVSYDAPGHGDSRGAAGTILDHQQIVQLLAERHGPFDGVVAHSLGVPFALYAVRNGLTAPAVITIGGVCDFGFLVDAMCGLLRLRPEVNRALRRTIENRLFGGDRDIWRNFSADVPALNSQLLIIHDTDDETVSPTQADALASAYGTRARRLTTSGLGHHRILSDAQVIDAAVDFLREAVLLGSANERGIE